MVNKPLLLMLAIVLGFGGVASFRSATSQTLGGTSGYATESGTSSASGSSAGGISLSGISSDQSSTDKSNKIRGNISITDDTNVQVVLSEEAERVVAISSADSELLLALGIDPVGVVSSKELPKDVQERLATYNNMNSAVSPSIEKIIDANPDLVIGIAMPFQTALRKAFNENKIPSFYHLSGSYQGIVDHIEHVGIMTGRTDAARALIDKYNTILAEIRQRHQGEHKRVLIVFGTPSSYQLASSKTYVGDIFKLLGADNVADVYLPQQVDGELLDGYIPLNLETMSLLDCDQVILINHGSTGDSEIEAFKKAFKSPAWQNVPAVAKGNISVLPGPLFSSVPTARMDQVLLHGEEVLYGQSH